MNINYSKIRAVPNSFLDVIITFTNTVLVFLSVWGRGKLSWVMSAQLSYFECN